MNSNSICNAHICTQKRPSGIDLNGDESAATTVELCLERLRLNDALSARDAVAQHLAAACVSVRQKTATIKTLEQEKSDLEMQLSFMNGRQEAALARSDNVGRTVQEREWTKVQVEVGALAEILRKLEHENKQLKTRLNGEEHDVSQDTGVAPVRTRVRVYCSAKLGIVVSPIGLAAFFA